MPTRASKNSACLIAPERSRWLWLGAVSLLASLLLLLVFSGAAQAIVLGLSLEELVSGADNIVLGQVSATSSQWNADRTHILTAVTITVAEAWKGGPGSGSVVIMVPGGEVGGITERVSDAPEFLPGERVVVFLSSLLGGEFEVYGQAQGKLIVAGDSVAGFALADFKERVGRALSGDATAFSTGTMATAPPDLSAANLTQYDATTAPQITAITPPKASAGTNTPITITGTNFGTTPGTVNFFYRPNQPFIIGSIISWSDTSIVVTVPIGTVNSYPASASSGPVYVHRADGVDSPYFPFTLSFSYGGQKWVGASPAVTIAINPNTADTTGEEVAVQTAVATWNAVPNHRFQFVVSPQPSGVTSPGYDGVNAVLWQNLGGTGPVARVSSWEIGGTVVEADLVFNDFHTWSTATPTPAGQVDTQSVALHELGHFLILSDIYGDQTGYPQDSDKVMFGFYYASDMKRTLHPDDQAGIQWIYPATVTFADANLEAAVRTALSKPTGDIYLSEMQTLTELDARALNIVNLAGLESATNLTRLRLDGNQVSDLSPLVSLTSLNRVELPGNQVSDIKPLVDNSGLAQGDEVDLQGNPLSATSRNTYIPQLQARGVTVLFNPSDVVTFPDANLEAAIRAALNKPAGDILRPDMLTLTSLSGFKKGIADLSGLEFATSLTDLQLQMNQISDISSLATLVNLTLLNLEGNQITSVTALASLTSLAEIYLSFNQLADISSLGNLTKLTTLSIAGNQISNLSALSSLTSLTWLDLQNNQISDIAPLAPLTELTLLRLSGNQISDVAPLVSLTRLSTLRLDLNQITNVSPLASLVSLSQLYLSVNQISEVAPLTSLTNLTVLGLDRNRISDISPLSSLTNLVNLILFNNQISDIAPLASLTGLFELGLGSNQISDISPLIANTGLATGDRLDLTKNPLNANSFNVLIPQLQARGVSVSFDTESAPAAPANVSPANGAKVGSLMPTLQASAFSDVDALDTHLASQWQVTTEAGNYASPVFDSGTDTVHLTSIRVPDGKLSSRVTYYWHVRYQDSRGGWSDWSAETAFTALLAGDANGDGKLNALDITKIERMIAILDVETPEADADLSGSINAMDITKIERLLGGLDRY